jgi:hypothetical protein
VTHTIKTFKTINIPFFCRSVDMAAKLCLHWYDDGELKKATVDTEVSSWESLRAEAANLTTFISSKLQKLRFYDRDFCDLEGNFEERDFFSNYADHGNFNIILIDPEDRCSSHGNLHIMPWFHPNVNAF